MRMFRARAGSRRCRRGGVAPVRAARAVRGEHPGRHGRRVVPGRRGVRVADPDRARTRRPRWCPGTGAPRRSDGWTPWPTSAAATSPIPGRPDVRRRPRPRDRHHDDQTTPHAPPARPDTPDSSDGTTGRRTAPDAAQDAGDGLGGERLRRRGVARGRRAGRCPGSGGSPAPPRAGSPATRTSPWCGSDEDGTAEVVDRQQRFFTWAQRKAMIARDGDRCAVPYCDRPVAWSDGHHLIAWEHGGPTIIDNGALPCAAHHTLLHEGGWTLHRLPDGTLPDPPPRREDHRPRRPHHRTQPTTTPTPGVTRTGVEPGAVRSGPVAAIRLLRFGRRAGAFGTWRSLVAHLTGGQGVAGSNPVVPTGKGQVRGTSLRPGPQSLRD